MNNYLSLLIILLSLQVVTAESDDVLISEKADRLTASRHYESGRTFLDGGQPEAALAEFDKAIGLFDYDANYHLARAKSLSALQRYDEAYECILHAIDQAPGQVDFANTAGTICFRLEKYEKAIRHFSDALNPTEINKGDVDRANVFYNRGISYLMLGEYEQAEKDFGEAIARNDTFVQAYHNRGVALNRLHKYDEACKDFMKAVELGNESSFNYVKGDCK